MTTPFTPDLGVLTDGLTGGAAPQGSVGGSSSYLPDGSYDIFNLGKLYNQQVYLGQREPTHVDTSTLAGVSAASSGLPTMSTVKDWIQQAATLSVNDPQSFAALQQQLYAAHFYTKKPRIGVWTPNDATALKDAVTGYLQIVNPNSPAPMTMSDYLDHAAQQGQQDDKAAASAVPVQVTDPAAIRSAAAQAFQAATGKAPTPGQLDTFVSQFQSAQVSAQQGKAAAKASGQQATVSMPDLTAQAGQFAQQEDPQAFQTHQRQSYENALVNLFAPSQSQRPNTQPVTPTGG